jgi:hypothetical protein
MRRRWIVACVFLLAALVAAAAAGAGGGNSIAAAPTVQYGLATAGDTRNGGVISGYTYEWWLLPLIAGDHVTVKFQNPAVSAGAAAADLYPPRTDDFNILQTNGLRREVIGSNGHAQLDFDAPSSGAYRLNFEGCPACKAPVPGPYDFTATVVHVARLEWPAQVLKARGTLLLHARYPDRRPIESGLGVTLYGFWNRKWHKLGQAVVGGGGDFRIGYSIPLALRSGPIMLRVAAGGPGFRGVKLTRTVRVNG